MLLNHLYYDCDTLIYILYHLKYRQQWQDGPAFEGNKLKALITGCNENK